MLFIEGADDLELVAPAGGVRKIVTAGPLTWWRITLGPFAGGFVSSSPPGLDVRPRAQMCDPSVPGLPQIKDECGGR